MRARGGQRAGRGGGASPAESVGCELVKFFGARSGQGERVGRCRVGSRSKGAVRWYCARTGSMCRGAARHRGRRFLQEWGERRVCDFHEECARAHSIAAVLGSVGARLIEAHERSETARVNATRVTCASSHPRSGLGWLSIPPSAARDLYASLAAGELEGKRRGDKPGKALAGRLAKPRIQRSGG